MPEEEIAAPADRERQSQERADAAPVVAS
jgi:hypothetical protein